MYRKLKNILGVSLMVLAVLLAQIPMPEAQAEIENGSAVQQDMVQSSTVTVTFSMNGGNFYGTYNDYEFKNQSPVLVLDSKEKIASFPSDKGASYNSYKTDKETWYTDKECLTVFDKESEITESVTLYKKWYYITSDGTTLADKGFYISPDGTVLYKYDGSEINVEIPNTVTTIAAGAFETLEEVRGITLPPNIERIDDNAFSGAESGEKIIYVYDSQTEQSKHFGKTLDDKYEQLVYSEYLDKEKVEEMVGINYSGTEKQKAEDTSKNTNTNENTNSAKTKDTTANTDSAKTGDVVTNTGSAKTEESEEKAADAFRNEASAKNGTVTDPTKELKSVQGISLSKDAVTIAPSETSKDTEKTEEASSKKEETSKNEESKSETKEETSKNEETSNNNKDTSKNEETSNNKSTDTSKNEETSNNKSTDTSKNENQENANDNSNNTSNKEETSEQEESPRKEETSKDQEPSNNKTTDQGKTDNKTTDDKTSDKEPTNKETTNKETINKQETTTNSDSAKEDSSSNEKESSNKESSNTNTTSGEEGSSANPTNEEESSQPPTSSEEGSSANPTNEEESSQPSTSGEESPSTKPSEKPETPSSPGVIEIDPDKKYTVTFKTGIPDVSGEKREVLNGRTISEMVSVDGKQPTLLKKDEFALLKDDGSKETTYTFEGWYKDAEYTVLWDFANDTVESDITIYAKWNAEAKAYYSVTFKAEGAKNIPAPIKVYDGDKLKKPSKNPKIANKEFKGWYTGEAESDKKFSGWNKPIKENITLYARWEENGYSVTFDMNGGGFTGNYNGGAYNNASNIKTKVALGKGIDSAAYPESVTSANMKYNNYNTDSNWYTDKECLAPYSKKNSNGSDKVLEKDITLYKKWYYTNSGFTMNPNGAVLYKYNGSSENVVIPSTITTIGENAFSNLSGIASITLPEKIVDVRSNAFSGLEKVSKDVTITAPANAENAQKKAQELAKQYKHLVYKSPDKNANSDKKEKNSNETVSVVDAGTIKLGASGVGNNNSSNNQEKTTDKNNNTSKITVGINDNGKSILGSTAQQISNAVTLANAQAQANAAKASVMIDPDTGAAVNTTGIENGNNTSVNTTSPSQTSGTASGVTQTAGGTKNASSASSNNKTGTASNAAASQTTVRNSAAAASAPRSNEHIKDATPKTGDPIQYRMLLVCCLFSIGVLLLLTGNGNKKKAAAS